MKISGSKAFVTGGANGIGAGICETLLKYGSEVYIADINEEQGKVLERKFRSLYGADRVTFVKCDVSNEQQFTDAFNKVVTLTGHIDLMINNAGILNERNWKLTMGVNLGGVILGTNLAVAHMRKDKGGKGGVIINTGSAAALFPRFAVPVYSATKAGIVQFTSSLASNPYLDAMGIRVSTVNPEGTVTEMLNSQKEENNVYYKDFEERLTTVNLLTVDQVVEGFVKIIGDDDTNGTHFFVTTDGIKSVKEQIVLQ